jgi:hypothetical protein
MWLGIGEAEICIDEVVMGAIITDELPAEGTIVEAVTSGINIMNERFGPLCPLGILPGLVNLAGRLSRTEQSQ